METDAGTVYIRLALTIGGLMLAGLTPQAGSAIAVLIYVKSSPHDAHEKGEVEVEQLKTPSLQMMLMALQYERESRLNLEDFFNHGEAEFSIVDDLAKAIKALRDEK